MANGLRLLLPGRSAQTPFSLRTRSIRAWIGLLSLCALACVGLATTARDAYAAGRAVVQETDTDEDGMPNDWEVFFGLNPNDPGDADDDPDSDGMNNAAEYAARRHPFSHHVRYFAEGATGFFDTSIAVVNLSTTQTAHVALALSPEGGAPISHRLTLGPRQRTSVPINTVLGGMTAAVSIIVESDVPVAADRTMAWGAPDGGVTLDSGSPAPGTTWYFAEGATGSFLLYYLLQNPGTTVANVTVRYLSEGAGTITKTHRLEPQSRTTIFVNDADPALATVSVAAIVTSDVPILADRAMYLTSGAALLGGSASSGSDRLSTQWYFGEGATGPFFHAFLSLLNPGVTPSTATVAYHMSTGATASKEYVVAPGTRRTVYFNAESLTDAALAPLAMGPVWFSVTSTQPIAAERAMWWPFSDWYEGHAATGSLTPGVGWAVPGGVYEAPGSQQTFILVGNVAATAGRVRFTLIDEAGAATTRELPIGALERLTVEIGTLFELTSARFSVIVDSIGASPVPIVVDYARYASSFGQTFKNGGVAPAVLVTGADIAPVVTATTPANGATDASSTNNVQVTFSEPVNVAAGAFILQCPTGTPIALTNLTASPSTTFALDPAVALPPTTACTLTVVGALVTDADTIDPPNALASDFTARFTTAAENAPTVTSTTPAAGAASVSWSANLTITFSEPVTVTGNWFQIVCGTSGTRNVSDTLVSGGPTTFTIDPTTDFAPSETCMVTVTGAQVTDEDVVDPPDAMAADHAFSFTAEPCPTVTVSPNALSPASTGVPFSQTFTQVGLTGTATWSLTGTLPAGMTFNTATGELAGTPTQSGSFPITVTATGPAGCFGSVSVTISVNCPAIAVSPNTLPTGAPGTPYSQIFTQVGTSAPVTWSLSGTLPTGMTFNTATGELAGTPTQFGSFPITVTATDANGCSGFVAVTLTIDCPVITVSPSTLPAASTGTPFSQVFSQVGASGTVTWSLSGTLPTGMTFNSATGELSGTPTQSGSFPVTVTATDANGCSGSVSVTIEVTCPTITIGPSSLPGGTTGTSYPSTQLTQTGGTTPITWSVASGTLPTGLTLSSGGLLSGTPTAPGTFNFTAQATDANGCSGTQAYTVNIVCPTINVTTAAPAPDGVVGQVYAAVQFQQTGGTTPITWSISAGALPAGLTLNPSTGQITGTPTAIGEFTVTVTATDANGCTGSVTITFDITCPTITLGPSSPLGGGLFNTAYTPITITANGGATPHTFAVTAGSLPPNMTLASNGQLSGTPNNTGAFTFTVTATDGSSANCSGSQPYSLTVRPVAQGDSFTGAVGNTDFIVDPTPPGVSSPTAFNTVSGTVVTNDLGPGTLTAVAGAFTTTGGGAGTMNSDGTFFYRPLTGFTGPTDTFTYTLVDGNTITNTGTVTIPIADIVWYVDSGGSHGNGTSSSPFQHLDAATTSSTINHDVFVYGGGPATSGDMVLEAGQTLHGQGSNYVNGGLLILADAQPVLSGTITLATSVTVNSLTVNSGSDAAIVGTSAATGTVSINGVNVTGGSTGLELTNVPATVNVVGGAFSGVSGAEVRIHQGAGDVNIGASITNTAGRSVHVTDHTGDLTVTGAVNDTGQGILLDNNNTSVMTFSGGLTLSTGANVAFRHVNGGQSHVTGANNTITTTSATAIELLGTTGEHQSGTHTWRSITATGAAKGISVQWHDSPFTVTGTDSADPGTLPDAGTGGTISNMTNRGAEFVRVTGAVSLGGMNFTNTGTVNGTTSTACGSPQTGSPQNCAAAIHLEHTSGGVGLTTITANGGNQIGINGTNVTNLVMTGVEVANFGTEVDEHGVQLHNLTGTGSLTNGNIHDNQARQFYISNGSGALTLFAISNSTFDGNTDGPNGLQGVQLETFNAGTSATITTTGSVISDNFNTGWQAQANSNSTLTAHITSSDLTNNNAAVIIQASSGGTLITNIENNETVTGELSGSGAMSVKTDGGSTMTASIRSNRIGNSTVGSGALCSGCNGIFINPREGGFMDLEIIGNLIEHVPQRAISVDAGQQHLASGEWGKADIVITGNLIRNPDNAVNSLQAIALTSGIGETNEASCLAATIGGLVNPGVWPSTTAGAMNRIEGDWFPTPGGSGNELRVRRRDGNTFHLPGLTGDPLAWLTARNSISSSNGTNVSVLNDGAGAFTSLSTCQ